MKRVTSDQWRVARWASIVVGKWNINLIYGAVIALFQFGQPWTRFVRPKPQFASRLNLIRGINYELHAVTLLLFLCFVTSNLRAAATAPVGTLDVADCTHCAGWATDPSKPTQSVKVSLFVDGQFSISATANKPRSDVAAAGYGPNHGFDFPLPKSARDGVQHGFSLRVTGTSWQLWNSPRTFTCDKPGPKPKPSPTPKPSPSVTPSPTATASPTPTPAVTPSPSPVAVGFAQVSWVKNTEPNIAGYHVLLGIDSGQYVKTFSVPAEVNSLLVPVPIGAKSFIAATAVNTNGAESAPSTEASWQP